MRALNSTTRLVLVCAHVHASLRTSSCGILEAERLNAHCCAGLGLEFK